MPSVSVIAPSRLHFGLYAFTDPLRAFGGVGAMIDRPGLRLTIRPAERFGATGLLAARTEEFAQLAAEQFGWETLPDCEIAVESAPTEHAGLGLGTQLGLAVAAGLNAFVGNDPLPAERLALLVGRGQRSAVGTHGFDHGGLILDGGHAEGQSIGSLQMHVDLPAEWRFLLATPTQLPGLSGSNEAAAFGTLAPIPHETTGLLLRIAIDQLLPAAVAGHFGNFAAALGQYGRLAGECFASVQGGPFASTEIAWLVHRLNLSGAVGSGQSSWGPTVFAVQPSQSAAEALQTDLLSDPKFAQTSTLIAAPSPTGASIRAID